MSDPSSSSPAHPDVWAAVVSRWQSERAEWGDWLAVPVLREWLRQSGHLHLIDRDALSDHASCIAVGRWLATCPTESRMQQGRRHYRRPDPSRPVAAPRRPRVVATSTEGVRLADLPPEVRWAIREAAAARDMTVSEVMARMLCAQVQAARGGVR
jgi:hypothetical protein